MKHGPILVMRYGPSIDWLDGPSVIGIARRGFTVLGALAWLTVGGIGRINRRWWIARAGWPAHRPLRRTPYAKGYHTMYAEDTKVPVAQSRAEIERLLGKVKARQFSTGVDYDKRIARVAFGLHDRLVRFTIALPDPGKLRGQRFEQAERQRWRALLLVIKAKLESVENAIETFEEAFLANIVMPNDQTVAELARPLIAESYQTKRMPARLLGPGDGDA